jgi:hypothetical protein
LIFTDPTGCDYIRQDRQFDDPVSQWIYDFNEGFKEWVFDSNKWWNKSVGYDKNELMAKRESGAYFQQFVNQTSSWMYGVEPLSEYTRLTAFGKIDPNKYTFKEYVNDMGPVWEAQYNSRTPASIASDIMDVASTVYLAVEGANFVKSLNGYFQSRKIGLTAKEQSIFNRNGRLNLQFFAEDESTIISSTYKYKHNAPKNISWNNIVESTKSGPAKYKYGTDIQKIEMEVYKTGTNVTNGKPWKVKGFDTIVGAKDGIETRYVRLEISPDGTVHSHPITPQEYKKLTR